MKRATYEDVLAAPENKVAEMGTRVTVIAGETDAPFELSAADEAELAESIAEADRGEVIAMDDLLQRLSR